MNYNLKISGRVLSIVLAICLCMAVSGIDDIETGINDGQVGNTVAGVILLVLAVVVALGFLAFVVEVDRTAPVEVVDLTECDVSLKMLREALCIAQADLDDRLDGRRGTSLRLQKLINLIDRHRPLDADGRHGNLHTATCGCEDKPNG